VRVVKLGRYLSGGLKIHLYAAFAEKQSIAEYASAFLCFCATAKALAHAVWELRVQMDFKSALMQNEIVNIEAYQHEYISSE
jgi:hypothetical protein